MKVLDQLDWLLNFYRKQQEQRRKWRQNLLLPTYGDKSNFNRVILYVDFDHTPSLTEAERDERRRRYCAENLHHLHRLSGRCIDCRAQIPERKWNA